MVNEIFAILSYNLVENVRNLKKMANHQVNRFPRLTTSGSNFKVLREANGKNKMVSFVFTTVSGNWGYVAFGLG